jgi:hypothetical protein
LVQGKKHKLKKNLSAVLIGDDTDGRFPRLQAKMK